MRFLSNFGCKIIFVCSVNFWHQQDSNSLFKGSIDHVTSQCKWPINPLLIFQAWSMLGNVEEIYELSIARLPTEPYDRTILSLLVSTVFSSVGENINTTLFIIIFIVLVQGGKPFGFQGQKSRYMTSLPGMKKNNRAAKYILLVFKILLYQQTLNINFGKQTVQLRKDFTKVSRVGLLFDFNLQYRSIYVTFELLAQFSFASVL